MTLPSQCEETYAYLSDSLLENIIEGTRRHNKVRRIFEEITEWRVRFG